MRLLYLSNARLPTEKAHGGQIMQMCEAFAQAGLEVTLWHARRVNTPALAGRDPFDYYGITRGFALRATACVDLFPLAARLGNRRWMTRLAFIIQATTHTLVQLWNLRHTQADIFYTRDPLTILSLRMSGRGRRTFYEAHRFPGSRAGRWLQRLALRPAAGVVVMTRRLAEEYAGLGIPHDRLHLAPDGVRLERFADLADKRSARLALGLPEGAFIAGYLGRFHTMNMPKGLETLVAAAALTEDMHVCLVGGPEEAVTHLRAQTNLPEGRLHYLGQVPPGEVPRCLAAFDVCVMPSPWTRFFAYYTSPMKLFEYMASGRPIVATDLPSTREIVTHEESALLVPPGDPTALAAALRRLADDPDLGARLAAHARTLVEARYTWAARAAGILEFVRRGLEKG